MMAMPMTTTGLWQYLNIFFENSQAKNWNSTFGHSSDDEASGCFSNSSWSASHGHSKSKKICLKQIIKNLIWCEIYDYDIL